MLLFGGGRWIRTTESTANRFTVCPLWPLGNSPILHFLVEEVGAGRRTRTPDLLITNQLLYQLSYTSGSTSKNDYTHRPPFCQQVFLKNFRMMETRQFPLSAVFRAPWKSALDFVWAASEGPRDIKPPRTTGPGRLCAFVSPALRPGRRIRTGRRSAWALLFCSWRPGPWPSGWGGWSPRRPHSRRGMPCPPAGSR